MEHATKARPNHQDDELGIAKPFETAGVGQQEPRGTAPDAEILAFAKSADAWSKLEIGPRHAPQSMTTFAPYKRSQPIGATLEDDAVRQTVIDTILETKLIGKAALLGGISPSVDERRGYGGAAGIGGYVTFQHHPGPTLADTVKNSVSLTGNAGGEVMLGGVRVGGGGNLSTDPAQTGPEWGGGLVCGVTGANSVTGPAVGCNVVALFDVAIQKNGGISIGFRLDPRLPIVRTLHEALAPLESAIRAKLKDKFGGRFDNISLFFYASLSAQNPKAEPYTRPAFELFAGTIDETNKKFERFANSSAVRANPYALSAGLGPAMQGSIGGAYLIELLITLFQRARHGKASAPSEAHDGGNP